MIFIDSGVTNINGTPGIQSDIAANKPLAADVQEGTIYIETDTGNMYQSTGGIWVPIGKAVVESQNWDQVLQQGGSLTNNRQFDFNSYALDFINVGSFSVGDGLSIDDINIIYKLGNADSYLSITEQTGTQSQAYLDVNNYGAIDCFVDIANNEIIYRFGDLGGIGSSYNYIQFNTKTVGTDYPAYFLQECYDGYNRITYSIENDYTAPLSRVTYSFNTQVYGLILDYEKSQFLFGDGESVANGNYFIIDDLNDSMLFECKGNYEIQATDLIFTGAALQSNSSGGNSGEHLVITLNGNQYKIKLENP